MIKCALTLRPLKKPYYSAIAGWVVKNKKFLRLRVVLKWARNVLHHAYVHLSGQGSQVPCSILLGNCNRSLY